MSEDMSEEMSIETSGHMPEKNVRKICQKERQKIYQKRISEDISKKDVRRYIKKGCQKICQTKMSEDVPKRKPIEMS